jgi:hypothetical protein
MTKILCNDLMFIMQHVSALSEIRLQALQKYLCKVHFHTKR